MLFIYCTAASHLIMFIFPNVTSACTNVTQTHLIAADCLDWGGGRAEWLTVMQMSRITWKVTHGEYTALFQDKTIKYMTSLIHSLWPTLTNRSVLPWQYDELIVLHYRNNTTLISLQSWEETIKKAETRGQLENPPPSVSVQHTSPHQPDCHINRISQVKTGRFVFAGNGVKRSKKNWEYL